MAQERGAGGVRAWVLEQELGTGLETRSHARTLACHLSSTAFSGLCRAGISWWKCNAGGEVPSGFRHFWKKEHKLVSGQVTGLDRPRGLDWVLDDRLEAVIPHFPQETWARAA